MTALPMPAKLIIMGVAGCGKSSLGAALAQALGLPLVEGDDFHGAANKDKMQRGVPLDDADRASWLDRLGEELRRHERGAVLTCSALKRAYRERLRRAEPGLRFIYLRIDPELAYQRVSARQGGHFFQPSLVASQFATLEPPEGETGVFTVDAILGTPEQARAVMDWIASESP
jgi:gluconokinase